MTEDYKLLHALATGTPVSDTPYHHELAEKYGLEVSLVGGELVVDSPRELFDPERLSGQLTDMATRNLSKLDIHWTIDSTNTFLLNLAHQSDFHGFACLAEQQTAGRGRRGRNWVSPFGKNIYLSLGWVMNGERNVEGLSLAVGVCVARAIASLSSVRVNLKWPNDILIEDGKAAGILVELAGGSTGDRRLVIGVGINLQLSLEDVGQIDQPWSVVAGVSRNQLAAALINELASGLQQFTVEGFEPFRQAWLALDAHGNKPVRIVSQDREVVGVSEGVDESGNLLLRVDGELRVFNAGEVSLRGADGA